MINRYMGRPRRIGEVWVRRESDEAAIFDPATGALHRLNPSALAIWELCDGGTSPREMAEAITELTDAGAQVAFGSVMETLRAMEAIGLIEFELPD